MHRLLIVGLLLTAAPAYADEDACKLVGRTMKAGELTRASLLVGACASQDEERGAKLDIALTAKFEELHYARVDIETRPTSTAVVLDSVADLPFETPFTVWLPPGVHTITALVDGQPVASTTLNLKSDGRGMAIIDLPGAAPPDNEVREIDFGEEGGPPELTVGGPEDEKFKSLLPDKYLRGMGAEGEAQVAREPRGEMWIGAGLTSYAILGVAIGVQGRYRLLGDRTRLGVALDGQAAGGYADGGVGALGAAAFVTFSHEIRFGSFRIRDTIGLGPGIRAVRADDGDATRSGPVVYVESRLNRRYSLVGRADLVWEARFWRSDPDKALALMLGVRW